MRHEKIIKRSDGSKIKIMVVFSNDSYTDKTNWQLTVLACDKGKRAFYSIHSTDDYTWRRLSFPEREEFILKNQLEHCSKEELLQAKLELWEKLKPTTL